MSGTIPKDLRPIIRRARKAGWSVSQTAKNHLLLEGPDGGRVTAPGTTANRRAPKRLEADLRRQGCPI